MSTSTCGGCSSAWSIRVASTPSTPAICRSMRTTSGRTARATLERLGTLGGLPDHLDAAGAPERRSVSPRRTTAWSSTRHASPSSSVSSSACRGRVPSSPGTCRDLEVDRRALHPRADVTSSRPPASSTSPARPRSPKWPADRGADGSKPRAVVGHREHQSLVTGALLAAHGDAEGPCAAVPQRVADRLLGDAPHQPDRGVRGGLGVVDGRRRGDARAAAGARRSWSAAPSPSARRSGG